MAVSSAFLVSQIYLCLATGLLYVAKKIVDIVDIYIYIFKTLTMYAW